MIDRLELRRIDLLARRSHQHVLEEGRMTFVGLVVHAIEGAKERQRRWTGGGRRPLSMYNSRSIRVFCDTRGKVTPPMGWSSELIRAITDAKAIARTGMASVLVDS